MEIRFSDASGANPSPQSIKTCHYFFPKLQETSVLFSFKLSDTQGIFGRNEQDGVRKAAWMCQYSYFLDELALFGFFLNL